MLCPFPCASLDSNERIDPYRFEHKAIRVLLGRLIESAGRTDFGDVTSRDAFRAILEHAALVLQRHASTEVLFIDAILAAHRPDDAREVQREHLELDDELAALLSEVRAPHDEEADVKSARARGHALYLRLTRFVATYLNHMAYEEEHVLALLRRNVDDVVLRRAVLAAQERRPFEERAITYVKVLEAIAAHERAALGSSDDGEPPPATSSESVVERPVRLIDRNPSPRSRRHAR